MKRIGELLTEYFGKENMNIANNYQDIFNSWSDIIKKTLNKKNQNAAGHSKILKIQDNILFIEVDHSGWTQILQSNQDTILNILHQDFSNLKIENISFMLKKDGKLILHNY
jgi:predicted nucleic acid-binding Zn ribbon protein